MGGFWLMWLQEMNCLNHIDIMHMLNVISKRTKPSSRDAMMDESHMKGSLRL